MGRLPSGARIYLGCVTAAAGACAVPAAPAALAGRWAAHAPTALLVAVLYAGCEQVRRLPALRERLPAGAGAGVPLLLAGTLLLPPPLAALTVVPGALLAPVAEPPAAARRLWRAAQGVVATGAASLAADRVAGLLHAAGTGTAAGGAPGGPAPVPAGALPGTAATALPFPQALLPALVAAAVLACVLGLTHGGVLLTAERRPARAAWRGLLLPALPGHLLHGLIGLMTAALWTGPYGPLSALLVLLPVCVSSDLMAQYHREHAAHQSTIRALVQAVDIKDPYTRGHSERVGRASLLIARELGLPEERVETLRLAGILHDVGKLGVPTRLLRKDGPLTDDERRVIELHPEYGHEIVRGIGFLGPAREAILHHHERLDGRGYPYGLAGEHIPEAARIVAVADAFDAMTSTRSYRRARAVPAALAELRACAGTQFDPRVVAALGAALAREGWQPENVTAAPLPAPLAGAAAPGSAR